VESGYDLRLVVRELARLTRDILVVNVDAKRLADPELAAESERDRLKGLAGKFSVEDLMRAFEVLTKAEYEIKGCAYPRYHLEMALLRWIHLRQLVPISDLIQELEKGAPPAGRPAGASSGAGAVRSVQAPAPVRPPVTAAAPRPVAPSPPQPVVEPARPAPPAPRPPSATSATVKAVEARAETRKAAVAPAEPMPDVQQVAPELLKDAFLNEVRKSKKFFYGTVVAQAQRIDIDRDRVVFTFAPQHRALKVQLDQSRVWLDTLASQLSGRKMTVVSAEGTAAPGKPGDQPAAPPEKDRQSELRQQALADSGVQAMLDVFAAEIKDVEEM
jgi:DNA polymerase III gamma/tau subunit